MSRATAMPQDLYAVLGVQRTASEDESTKAYRKLPRQFHPDRNPGDKQAEAKFNDVAAAPGTLADEAGITIPSETAAKGGTVSLAIGDRHIDLKVPAGIDDGKTMRLAGQGPNGADVLLKVHVEPHPHYRREGNDLVLRVPLSLTEAVLGGKVDVPMLGGGTATVTIKPGTSSGTRMRIRGQGVKGGDLYIEPQVTVPAPADARSRE